MLAINAWRRASSREHFQQGGAMSVLDMSLLGGFILLIVLLVVRAKQR